MIQIKKCLTADSRTCDVKQVGPNQLLQGSIDHINDVREAIAMFGMLLLGAGNSHDFDKITAIDQFYYDFQNKFQTTTWWDKHRNISRHHLLHADGIPNDVNLIDVLEFIADSVMAGKARNAENFYPVDIPEELLVRAFRNTVAWLEANVEVIE